MKSGIRTFQFEKQYSLAGMSWNVMKSKAMCLKNRDWSGEYKQMFQCTGQQSNI